jgi:uncharacterized protein with PIN domain
VTDDAGGRAQYERAELQVMQQEARTGAAPRCPRCEGTPEMLKKPIGGGSFGLGYQRRRVWYMCPQCRRSAMFDLERGTRL